MSGESQARFIAKCKCGAKLKVPVSAAGRKAKCPKCENIFVIPQHKVDKPAKVESDIDPFDDGTFGLEELAAMEKSAPAIESTSRGLPCPKCNTMLDGGVMLCVSCGYNRETGKTVKAARTKPSKIASLSKASGKFMLGTIFSGIGALVGAAIWFGIVMATDYQIGWLACGIGALCGYGMLKGYGKANMRAGLVASGMSVFGIVLAKFAFFIFIILAVFTGNTNNVDLQRQFIAVQFTNDIFTKRGIYDLEKRESLWEETFPEGLQKAVAMSDDEIQKRTNRIRAIAEINYADVDAISNKQIQIVNHRVTIDAEALGLYWSNSYRDTLLDNAYEEVSKYSPQEIESALENMKKWEKSGRWSDVKYVQHNLTSRCTDIKELDKYDKEQAAGNEDWESNEQQWKTFHGECSKEIEQLPSDQRLSQLRKMEADERHEYMPDELAGHYADIHAQNEGLSYTNENRSTFYDEEFERFSAMAHEELDKEYKKLEAWNNGDMWHDVNYVYTSLIYSFADEEVRLRREKHEDEENYWQPSEREWKSIHVEATQKADDIPSHQHKSKIEENNAAQVEKYQLAWQQLENDSPAGEEVAAMADDLLSVYMQSMWSPMDVIFLLLAVSTAYKIANGSEEVD